jgi:hypothetical protein
MMVKMKQGKTVAQGFGLDFKEANLIKAKALSYILLRMCNSALQG